MFCPNCGKELAEGEVCTCTPANEEIVNNPPEEAPQTFEPVQEAPQGAYSEPEQQFQQDFNPVVFPGAYYDPSQAYSNNETKEKIPARIDYPEGYKIKKKYVAVLLAASLGMFGIHNYYLGNNDKALAQVLIATVGGLLTFGLGLIATTIWATVEAVLLLTENIDKDSNGYKIQTFEESLAAQLKKD